jgi:hypothetical protein
MKLYIDRDAMLKAIAVERKKSHSDRKTLDWCREMIKSQARHQELLQFFHAKGFFVCLVNNIPEGWLAGASRGVRFAGGPQVLLGGAGLRRAAQQNRTRPERHTSPQIRSL